MLNEVVAKYLQQFPKDKKNLAVLLEQLKKNEKLDDRTNYHGHIAGSGLIFSPDLTKLLLIYHPTFERWMQPGGHLEPDEAGPWLTAARESVEETGAELERQLEGKDKRIPLLIESHLVPTKPPKNEPVHYHHNFWYAFVAKSEKVKLNDKVIKQADWIPTKEIKGPFFLKVISRAKPQLKA